MYIAGYSIHKCNGLAIALSSSLDMAHKLCASYSSCRETCHLMARFNREVVSLVIGIGHGCGLSLVSLRGDPIIGQFHCTDYIIQVWTQHIRIVQMYHQNMYFQIVTVIARVIIVPPW